MQRSEMAGRAREHDLGLDLRPPVRLDLWALLLATGIVATTVAPLIAAILFLASLMVSVAAAVRGGFVPAEWRAMIVLSPLFVAGGAGIALLHTTVSDPLLEFAEVEPGEVVVVGRVVSPPVPTKIGYRADVRVEHLWYEEKEVLRGGGVQVYSGDMRVGVGDRVHTSGELTRPEKGEDGFDYGRYLGSGAIPRYPSCRGLSGSRTSGTSAPSGVASASGEKGVPGGSRAPTRPFA